MAETYTWWHWTRRMTQSQRRRYLKKLKKSYKHAEELKKKLDEQKNRDALSADDELATNLDTLLT